MAELQEIDWSRAIAIECIDDRGLVGSQQNLKVGGAGPYGLAQDLVIARSLKYPATHSEGIGPLGEIAKIITEGLGRSALVASTHQECAAEINISPIGQTIIDRPEEVLTRANAIMRGNIGEAQYEQVAESYRRMLFDPETRVLRCVQTEAACMDTPSKYGAIIRKLLAHEQHEADTLQISYITDTWRDTAQSYREGQATYHIDQWAVRPIAEAIDEVLPHDNVDGFVLASSVRTAATSLLLPRSGDINQLGIDLKLVA